MTKASGVMRSVKSARTEDVLPVSLVAALRYHEGRFPDWAIGAVVAVADRHDLTPREWAMLLERASIALAPVFGQA